MRQKSIAFAAVTLLLVALAVACNGNTSMTPSPVPGGGAGGAANVTITINGMNGSQSFSPNPASIPAGQTVAWRNADSITHTATADNGAFDTGSISPGATSNPITMGTAGSFSYHCRIHPTMVGTVTVQ